MLTIMIILGALMNRIRGGWLLSEYNRTVNALVFGVAVGLLTLNPLTGFLASLAMFTGQSLGWGRYIGAVGDWESRELKEVAFIDFFITPFKDNRVLWGFLGLTLRGLVWGICIALPVFSWAPVIAGLAMGVVYFITTRVSEYGWELGEIIFGGILWGSLIFI